MSDSQEWHPKGYVSIGGVLPIGVSPEEISFSLFEMNNQVSLVAEPPIARIESAVGSFDPATDHIDDYRRFDVEIDPEATPQQLHDILEIVSNSIRRLTK